MKMVALTQGKVALVDDEDYDLLMQFKWHTMRVPRLCYAGRLQSIFENGRRVRRVCVLMHIAILGRKPGYEIDHIDNDGLNNQRANLRHCTKAENSWNRRVSVGTASGHKGVYLEKGRWRARIYVRGRDVNLGCFGTFEEAAEARRKATVELHGAFARVR